MGLIYHRTNQWIISCSADNTILIWNMNGDILYELDNHTNWVILELYY